jgi:TP901 family phage tail tape measure protein
MAATLAELGFDIRTDKIKGASKSLDNLSKSSKVAEKQTATSAKKMSQGFNKGAESVKRMALQVVALVGVSAGLRATVSTVVDFESALSSVRAITRSTNEDMEKLSATARTLGATTSFSAKEAASGMKFLGMAGFNTNEIIQAMPSTLALAKAGSLDLATAADIASNALSGFRINAEDMNIVADTLAATSSRSNTSIIQLGDALSYAAPIAASLDVSIQDTSAAIGVLSDAGLQASRAGTGLTGVFRQLTKITTEGEKVLRKYGLSNDDVSIKSLGFTKVLSTLSKAGLDTSDVFTLFGAEAGIAGQILLTSSGSVKKLSQEVKAAKVEAQQMAKVMEDNLAGDTLIFNSAISEATLSVSEYAGVSASMRDTVQSATKSISDFSAALNSGDLDNQIQLTKSLSTGVLAVAFAYGSMAVATRSATVAQAAFNVVARANPYALIASAALAAGVAVYTFVSAQKSAREIWIDAASSESAYLSASANDTGRNRINEILAERIELQKSLAKTFDGSKRQRQIQSKIDTLDNESNQITKIRIIAEKAQTARQAVAAEKRKKEKENEIKLEKSAADLRETLFKQETDARNRLLQQEADAAQSAYELTRKSVYGKLDLVLTEKEAYADLIAEIVSLGLTTNEQTRLIELAAKKHKAAMDELGGDSGSKTGDEFSRSFESSTANIANSLQDAIASGQWAGLGATIGGALAGGIAASVSDQITGAGFGSLASGLGGAVAGGVAGLAVQKISQLFASSKSDPAYMSAQESQGTGTVLGSLNEKTKSIENASEITAGATTELIGINRSMLNALNSVGKGIEDSSAAVARMFIASSLLIAGKTVKNLDEGIKISGGTISDLALSSLVSQFSDQRQYDGGRGTIKVTETTDAGAEVSNAVSLMFSGILKTVTEGAATFGIAKSAIESYNVAAEDISFKNMSNEERAGATAAYFGTIFDEMTLSTIPWLTSFQKAGEGIGETMARVATQTKTAQEGVKQLGFQFENLSGQELAAASTQLIELTGGVEQFIGSMSGFISNFASEAEQFRISQESINSALSQANLELPKTRDGYFDLLRAQDGSTKAGAENIATLLRLQSSASNYYDTLEDGAERAMESARSAASANLAQSQSAADAVDNALKGLSSVDNAQSRESALASIQSMTAAGRVGSTSDLQGTLSAATSISASDFATFNEYVRTVSRTGAAIGGLKQITDAKVTKDQQLLSNIEKEIAAMSKEIIELNKANVKQTAKSARILERIEVGGVRIIA